MHAGTGLRLDDEVSLRSEFRSARLAGCYLMSFIASNVP